MYKVTITAMLENDEHVMCEQTTVWREMEYPNAVALEGSFADWLASLPRTLGAAPEVAAKKR